MKSTTQQRKDLPHKYLASVFLSLGFLVVWTGVLAGVLITQTFKRNGEVKKSASLYHFHEKASLASFAVGEELFLTIDWIMNNSKAHHADRDLIEAQRKTDVKISEMSEPSLFMLTDKLYQSRQSIRRSFSPEEAIELYIQLNEEFLRKCFSIHQPHHEMPSPSVAFILFIQGAIKKFEEIALSRFYLKSSERFNSELKTKFLSSHVESNELIRTALQFVPKAQAVWWEAQYEHPIFSQIRDSILSLNRLKKNFESQNNKFRVKLHVKHLKNQIKSLKATRKSMSEEFNGWSTQSEKYSHNSLSFHLSLACAAVVVILFSIGVTGCSIREFGNSDRKLNLGSLKNYRCRNSALVVHIDNKSALPNTFLSSSSIIDPTSTSLDGRKSLISS